MDPKRQRWVHRTHGSAFQTDGSVRFHLYHHRHDESQREQPRGHAERFGSVAGDRLQRRPRRRRPNFLIGPRTAGLRSDGRERDHYQGDPSRFVLLSADEGSHPFPEFRIGFLRGIAGPAYARDDAVRRPRRRRRFADFTAPGQRHLLRCDNSRRTQRDRARPHICRSHLEASGRPVHESREFDLRRQRLHPGVRPASMRGVTRRHSHHHSPLQPVFQRSSSALCHHRNRRR